MENSKMEKRGPGRPPKGGDGTLDRRGIVSAPSVKEEIPGLQRIVEFYYDNPMIIKKVFGLYKQMNSEKISIFFTPDRVVFLSTNHGTTNYIHSEIVCKRVNAYYLEAPFTIGLDCNKIQKIMDKIDKDYQSITFWCNRDDLGVRLNISLYKAKLDNETTSKIVLEKPQFTELAEVERKLADEKNYPISFILDSKVFKKKISDANNLGPTLRIEKNGEDPLTFVTVHSNDGTDYDVFKSSGAIGLQSTVGKDDFFSTSVCLNTIKPLAAALIADDLKISIDTYNPMIFTALLERQVEDKAYKVDSQTCLIRVLSPVIDFRTK